MKTFRRYFIIFAVMVAAVSCKKEPTLSVSPSTINQIPTSGSTVSLSVDTNNEWTASATQSWVHISPSSGGSGKTSVTVTVDANSSNDDRTANITFSSAGLTSSVTINQSQLDAIILSSSTEEVGSEGKTITVQIKSNVEYQVEISDSWIKRTTTKGMKDYSETFQVEANTTYNPREGRIVIKSGSISGTVVVKQAQNDALIVSTRTFEMPAEGGNAKVKVSSNVGCVATVIEGEKWISNVTTKALADYDFTFNVAANDTYEDRVGMILISDEAGTLTDTVTINQSLNYGLFLTEDSAVVDKNGGEVEVVLNANVEYEYEITEGADWVKEIETKSLVTYKHLFQVSPYNASDSREAKIVFKAKDTDVTDVFTIIQTGNSQVLIFSHSKSSGIVPEISGSSVSGTIDWGDGTSSTYSKTASHKYRNSAGKTYQETLTLKGATGFKFESLGDLQSLDMSGF